MGFNNLRVSLSSFNEIRSTCIKSFSHIQHSMLDVRCSMFISLVHPVQKQPDERVTRSGQRKHRAALQGPAYRRGVQAAHVRYGGNIKMTVIQYHEGGFPPDKLDWDRLVPYIGPANAAVARYDGILSAVPSNRFSRVRILCIQPISPNPRPNGY